MGRERMRRKFFDCAAAARRPVGRERLEQIYETIFRLEELEDVGALFALL